MFKRRIKFTISKMTKSEKKAEAAKMEMKSKILTKNSTKKVLVLWTSLNGMTWIEANKEFELVC